MTEISHTQLMQTLAARHDAVLPSLIRAADRVDYVDVPMYGNVGDLLIMAGTLRWFERHGIRPARLATYFNYDVTAAPPGTTIVCQGGGNFGDIYGPFQRFREAVIAARRDCRVVVLPQSLHFHEQAAFERTVQVCRQHPDLHVCVRDTASQRLAQRLTDHVHLLPDMAHQLWPVTPTTAAEPGRVLQLRRRDAERGDGGATALGSAFDWDDLVGPAWRFSLSNLVERPVTQICLRLHGHALVGNWVSRWWIGHAQRFIAQAVDLFSRAEAVHSDRLHAHILACLLARPNVIDDNSYGKNSRYIDCWTGASPLVTLRRRAANADGGGQ